MNNQIPHTGSEINPLSLLEDNLAQTLKPVLPNPDFVRRLGYHILHPSNITVERRPQMKAFVVFSFALFSGIFLIWLLIGISRLFSGKGRQKNK